MRPSTYQHERGTPPATRSPNRRKEKTMFEKESLQGVGIGRPYGAAAAALETLSGIKRLFGDRRAPRAAGSPARVA
jgi:hypothetical protein